MKKIFVFLSILAVAMIFNACDEKEEPQKEITSKIQYDVYIKAPNPDYDWYINNIPGKEREEIVDWIFDNAYSGKLKAYDYFGEPLSVEEVKSAGTDTLLQTLMRTTEPYEQYDTTIVRTLDRKDIVKIRFVEAWYYEDDDEIEKEIIAIAPVREVFDSQGNFIANEPIFYLYFEDPDED